MDHLLKSSRYSWLTLETVRLSYKDWLIIVTQTPVAGYDAKKFIIPKFQISLNKFLFKYGVILAITSPFTTFVTFSKSSVSINFRFTRISFNINV